jgi:hypothetical protein
LTYKNFNMDHVMRWRLTIEEYGPELKYIKGERNIVADALSRLDMSSDKSHTLEETFMAELFGLDSEDIPKNPNDKNIMSEQKQDKDLLNELKNPNTRLKLMTNHWGGQVLLINHFVQ